MFIATTLLAASAASPQATLLREVQRVFQAQSVAAVPPGAIESPEVSDSLLLRQSVGLTNPIAGVEFTGLALQVSLEAHLDMEVQGLDPGLTTLTPGFNTGVFAAGSDASWGPSDGYNTGAALWNGTPPMIGGGESFTYDDAVWSDFLGWNAQAGGFPFQSVQQAPIFLASMGTTVRLPSENQSGPVDVEVIRMVLTTTIDLELNEAFELTEVPLVSYCSSPANSTGSTAALRAYGSRVAGSQWLSLEVTDLPEQAAAILFSADLPASVPLGTAQLCVGGSIRRRGGVQFVNQGSAVFHVDLEARTPGDEVHFQVIHRDPILGLAASEGVRLTVQP